MTKPHKSITQEELNKIIERHQHYLKQDVPDWKDCQAIFSSDVGYEGMDFSNADLTGAVFNHTWLIGADFSHAQLRSCTLNDVYANEANFQSANMQHVTIDQGRFYLADFTKANLYYAYFRDFNQNARGSHLCYFNQADLSFAYLSGNFSEASFRMADIDRTDIDLADFTLCDFQDATLAHSDIGQATMCGTYLKNANLSSSTLHDCWIQNVSFKNAELYNTSFADTSINNADFTKANLVKAELGRCRLLINCDFSLADLTDADFCKGDPGDGLFLDCDFSDAKTDGMKLNLERFCEPIGLPEGFGKTDIVAEEPTSNGVNQRFTPGNECKTFVPSRDEEDLEKD